jgi:hypothetical protein
LTGRSAQQNRQSGQLQLLLHDLSLIGGDAPPKTHAT